MRYVLLINGPNMNLLGQRKQSFYGSQTLPSLVEEMEKAAKKLGIGLVAHQSNRQGELVDNIQEFMKKHAKDALGVIINPASLTGNGYSILDALIDTNLPFVEVHISNIHARETFRKNSIFASFAKGQIAGLGTRGYLYALEYLGGIE